MLSVKSPHSRICIGTRNAGKDHHPPERLRRDHAVAFSCSTRRAVPTHSPSGLPFCPHLAADALALLLGLLLTAIYCRCVTSSCICQNLLCEDISTK